ncbi:LysM peptidoglycan-binding domain-containing protein, partial [Microvirga sp. 3-52]|nr:LysM peptidoglycan-binding domain-containing protein [Microvirga sp. 3-52]
KKYTVKKGDTLSKIAKDQDISLNDLIVWNQITSYLIFPNDQLIVSGEKSSIIATNIELHPTKIKVPLATSTTTASAPVVAKAAPAVVKAKPAAAKSAPVSTGGREMTMTATAYTAYCEGCS